MPSEIIARLAGDKKLGNLFHVQFYRNPVDFVAVAAAGDKFIKIPDFSREEFEEVFRHCRECYESGNYMTVSSIRAPSS